jgi:hypothetical protein
MLSQAIPGRNLEKVRLTTPGKKYPKKDKVVFFHLFEYQLEKVDFRRVYLIYVKKKRPIFCTVLTDI